MSICTMLAGGDPRSLGETEQVVAAVLQDRSLLDALFDCLFVEDDTVRMRASDALEKVCRQHPAWFAVYTPRLLHDVPRIRQASVQWHLAQMLGELPLTDAEKQQAVAILCSNLETMDDWIVTNLTLESLAGFVRDGAFDRDAFVGILKRESGSRHKSVAKRASKLLDEFGSDSQHRSRSQAEPAG